MVAASVPSHGTSVVGVVQWTLVGIQLVVLAWMATRLGRGTRLGRLLRRLWRVSASGEGTLEVVGRARPARLVSVGSGASQAALPRSDGPVVSGTRPTRGRRTPARGIELTGATAPRATAPAGLHCPGCGALIARGELTPWLVTRCPGCERRVAVRSDSGRLVVTLER